MTTATLCSKRATARGATGMRASWRECHGAVSRVVDSGIGLVVVDASRRGCAVPVAAGHPSHPGGAANGPFAIGF